VIIVRRTVVICAALAAFLLPAAVALAVTQAAGDGTLVVENGNAPRGVAVVTLVIRGAAIGQVTGVGKVVIDDPTPGDGFDPEVTGADWRRDSSDSAPSGGTETTWGGTDFRFRAVGGTYKITVYGSDVDLVASGHGTVVLAGTTDTPTAHDGRYSLNGAPSKSLPATPTKLLTIAASTTANPG
jgi:hypothetical protein